ncbi:hypothetical protein NDU88_007634 [Pleurodeles waltl]|uniref:Uncharacterized protein n=1 Tax=Pleurodeles waltl TaxID=8319 RepID=A0AAV7PLZ8_PLEWA|nr:hypothetical protein NDU88_007634 [Pleurodeles waltl]
MIRLKSSDSRACGAALRYAAQLRPLGLPLVSTVLQRSGLSPPSHLRASRRRSRSLLICGSHSAIMGEPRWADYNFADAARISSEPLCILQISAGHQKQGNCRAQCEDL